MDNFGNMGVNMGVTVRVISKGSEEVSENTAEKTASEQIKPVIIEKADEKDTAAEKENGSSFRYHKGYKPKTDYIRFGFGAVVAVGAVISAVMLLSLWAVKGFGGEEAALIAERIICEIG